MKTHPYEYDRTLPWIPQQNQVNEGGRVTAYSGQQQLPRSQNQGLPKHSVGQKPRVPEKMPKARALALANTFKRWFAVASIVGFGTLGGLVALHQVGTSTTTSQSTQSSSGSSNTSSTSSSSSQSSNNFLKQQGGNTSGTSSSSTSSSSSTPVSGTSTS